jgi:HTH-type transcriptional regulator, glycine betaine synthesis regulator
MAEVHALLYISGQALCTDDIMERLEISRGNASMSIRALLDWGIVQRAHKRGDRKEYFQAEQDVWALFRAIVRERITREVDPLLASMHEIRDMTAPLERAGRKADQAKIELTDEQKRAVQDHNRRLEDMLGFLQMLERLGHSFISPAGRGLRAAASMLARFNETSREPVPPSEEPNT